MKKRIETMIGTCTDCCTENVKVMLGGIYEGLCDTCKMRKARAKSRGKEYTPFKDLSQEEKSRIGNLRSSQILSHNRKKAEQEKEKQLGNTVITAPIADNYYQAKAEQVPITTEKIIPTVKQPSLDQPNLVNTLRECGCVIPETDLKDILDVLMSTDKLKDIFTTIAKSKSQQAILDLEQCLNVVERKLQHNWEFNGFQEEDDIKFKNFLKARRTLKGAIFFWKKLYQTNCIIEMQRAWNAYTQDPNEKITLAGEQVTSAMKRFQITTESISTILNTRKPFTRIFYATSKENAYTAFTKWMAERQLHENKSKTIITELSNEGEDGRNGDKK